MTTYEELERRWEALASDLERRVDAVTALHRKVTRYTIPATAEYHSYESLEAALQDWADEEELPVEAERVGHFDLCAECSRVERESWDEQAETAEWGYVSSLWPCRTATTLGIA